MSELKDLELPSWIRRRDEGRGPWCKNIKLALSDDGLNFVKTNRTLVDRGDVSNLCRDSVGRIIASYQYFSFLNEKDFNKITVSMSLDEGENWEGYNVIKLHNIERLGCFHPCDPYIVLLDDGKLRLYFTCAPKNRMPGTVSAISSNGLDFEVEDGYRFILPETEILDPTVLKIGNEWHYYAPWKYIHAISSDGLNFNRVEDVSLPKGTFMLGGGVDVDGGYRFYTSTRTEGGGVITSAFSEDGYKWKMDPRVRIEGFDPGIVKLKNGKYLLSYSTRRV